MKNKNEGKSFTGAKQVDFRELIERTSAEFTEKLDEFIVKARIEVLGKEEPLIANITILVSLHLRLFHALRATLAFNRLLSGSGNLLSLLESDDLELDPEEMAEVDEFSKRVAAELTTYINKMVEDDNQLVDRLRHKILARGGNPDDIEAISLEKLKELLSRD